MQQNAVDWFEIYVENMDRAKKFYESVFKVQLSPLDNAGVHLCTFPRAEDGAGAAGALVKMEGFASGANSTLVYFRSQDCAVEEKRASDSEDGFTRASSRSVNTVSFPC